MPKILEKRKVLNGRGIVGQFGVGTSEGKFFYREKVEGKKVLGGLVQIRFTIIE